MRKDHLRILNLNEDATKEQIYERYIQLHVKYKKENNNSKLTELDKVYGELLTTESTPAAKTGLLKNNTKVFVFIFILIMLSIALFLYYQLNKGITPKAPTSPSEITEKPVTDEDLKPLGSPNGTQTEPYVLNDSHGANAMQIADSSDLRLQLPNKQKIEVVESFINSLKSDQGAQNKIMSCYFKYQEMNEPGIPCVYMDAAAEFALNTPGKGASNYFSSQAVTERAQLHLYSINNISSSVAHEHLKQVRFDVSQIVTDLELKKAKRIGANLEQAPREEKLIISDVENDEDDAVRAARMAALPALDQ